MVNYWKMDKETKEMFWKNVHYFGGKLIEAIAWICTGIGILWLLSYTLDVMF